MDLGLSNLFLPIINWISSIVGNWGVSIILFTLLFRLVLLPLDIKQRKDARKMAAIQPKIAEINKRYANDEQKKAAKTMELYKTEKVSMFSGCLPMLIQMPIFVAMANVLRQAGDAQMLLMYEALKIQDMAAFHAVMDSAQFLWIRNIWQPDSFLLPQGTILPQTLAAAPDYAEVLRQAKSAWPIYEQLRPYLDYTNGLLILAVLSGVSQFFSMKLMNAQQQPAQAAGAQDMNKNMKIMNTIFPLMSVYFCAVYNAGFALYWVFSGVFGILVQVVVRKILDRDEKKPGDAVVAQS